MSLVAADTTPSRLGTTVSWQMQFVSNRDDLVLTVNIDKVRFRVGRRDSADLTLSSAQVSGFHAEFVIVGIRLFVRDLGSTNGTYVNGRRINHHDFALRDGDRVRMADVEFVIRRRRHDEPAADTAVLQEGTAPPASTAGTVHDPASVLD